MLSYEAFERLSVRLAERNPEQWRWIPSSERAPGAAGMGYLAAATKVHIADANGSGDDGDRDDTLAENLEHMDMHRDGPPELPLESDPSELPTVLETMCVCEYHVLYSSTYRVPVIYLNATRPCGLPLMRAELMVLMGRSGGEEGGGGEEGSGGFEAFVTQDFHPILGTTFFFLHPCRTADLMAAALPGIANTISTATQHGDGDGGGRHGSVGGDAGRPVGDVGNGVDAEYLSPFLRLAGAALGHLPPPLPSEHLLGSRSLVPVSVDALLIASRDGDLAAISALFESHPEEATRQLHAPVSANGGHLPLTAAVRHFVYIILSAHLLSAILPCRFPSTNPRPRPPSSVTSVSWRPPRHWSTMGRM